MTTVQVRLTEETSRSDKEQGMETKKDFPRKLMPYPNEDSDIKLMISPGLEVTHILMSDEYTDCLVFGTEWGWENKTIITEELIKEALSNCGEIESFIKYSSEEKDKFYSNSKTEYNEKREIWGKIRFKNPESAHNAARLQDQGMIRSELSLRPLKKHENRNKDGVVVTMTTCRRPYLNKVEVQYRDPQDPRFLKKNNSVYLSDNAKYPIRFALCDNEDTINMAGDVRLMTLYSGLDEFGNEPELRKAIEKKMAITVVSLERSRVRPFRASRHHYNDLRRCLEQHIKENFATEDFTIDIPTVDENDIYMEAKVCFPDNTDVEKLLTSLKEEFKLGPYRKEVVKIDPRVAHVVYVPEKIWNVTNEGIEMIRKTFSGRASKGGDSINWTVMKNGSYRIEIQSKCTKRSKVVYNAVKKVVHPNMVTGASREGYIELQRKSGRALIGRLVRCHGIHIDVQREKGGVFLYGHPDATKAAAMELSDYLGLSKNVPITYWKIKTSSFRLHGISDDEKVEFLLGHKKRIEQIFGVSRVQFDKRLATISITGNQHGYYQAKRLMGSLLRYKFGLIKNTSGTSVTECCACLSEIEPPMYRLRSCGHEYCESCAKMHVKIAAEDKKFPILCLQEDCAKPINLPDIQDLFNFDAAEIGYVMKHAVDYFVVRNKDGVKYCGTRDCSSVYRCTNESKSFKCGMCDVEWCTRCHDNAHPGIACAMHKLVNRDHFDPKLKEWILEEPKNRKICPKCESGIEKVDGCNNIHCTNCRASICWDCLAHFDNSSLCYDHLNEKHAGYYGDV